MATLSSILSWRIPWREEPGGLESIWSAKRQAPLKQGSTQAHKQRCVCECVCVCVCVCVRALVIKIAGGGMVTLSSILS